MPCSAVPESENDVRDSTPSLSVVAWPLSGDTGADEA